MAETYWQTVYFYEPEEGEKKLRLTPIGELKAPAAKHQGQTFSYILLKDYKFYFGEGKHEDSLELIHFKSFSFIFASDYYKTRNLYWCLTDENDVKNFRVSENIRKEHARFFESLKEKES